MWAMVELSVHMVSVSFSLKCYLISLLYTQTKCYRSPFIRLFCVISVSFYLTMQLAWAFWPVFQGECHLRHC